MSLPPPPKVQKLQEALHAKAKGSPGYRFYALYDKVYRKDVLEWAYVRCRANDGAPGVDRQTFEDIEAYGLDRWLDELAAELKERRRTDRNRCDACSSRNRMASNGRWGSVRSGTAWRRWPWCWSWSRSSRPTWSRSNTPTGPTAAPWTPSGRSTGWSTRGIRRSSMPTCRATSTASRTPNSIKSLSRRISDRHLLGLIKMWLEAPVEEIDERGRHHRTTRNKDEGRGSPQGSPLSPLLANIYMRRFVRGWKALGHERRLDAHDRQLRRRLRDLLSGHRRRGDGRDAGHDVEAEADGERGQDAAVPRPRGDVRLPGLHDRPVSTRRGRAGPTSGRARRRRRSQRLRDEIRELTDRRWLWTDGRGPGGATEPEAAGLVELLLPRPRQRRRTVPSTGTAAIGSASGCAGSTR